MGGDAIFRSTDMGNTFIDVQPDTIGRVGLLRIDKEDNIYFTCGGPLFYSKDNGETFKKMNQGILDSVAITDIFVDENQAAYICTYHDGVFRTDNFTSIDDKEIDGVEVGSVYPNPASDYIIISSPSIKRGLGGVLEEIRIYDVFGNCDLTVETQNFVSLQRIDVSALPAGVYFVRIGNKKPQKFMVVR